MGKASWVSLGGLCSQKEDQVFSPSSILGPSPALLLPLCLWVAGGAPNSSWPKEAFVQQLHYLPLLHTGVAAAAFPQPGLGPPKRQAAQPPGKRSLLASVL